MQQSGARLQALFGALSGLLAGCPVAIPVTDQIAFACKSTAECSGGQICVANLCQRPSTNDLDASRVDAARVDTLMADVAGTDTRRADAAGTDTARTDAASPDVAPVDSARGDGVATDTAQRDSAIADTVQPDTNGSDSASPDSSAPDAATPDAAGADACLLPAPPTWWDTSYAVRFPLDVAAAPAGYTIEVVLAGADASAVFGACAAAGRDLRLVYHGTGVTEIDRDLRVFNASNIVVRFRIQEPAGFAGGARTYFLYAGNAAAPAPRTDGHQVYLLFEDFEGYNAGDNGAPAYSGLPESAWRVVDDSGNRVYQGSYAGRTTLQFVGQDRLDAVIEARIKYLSFSMSTDWVALQYRGSNFDPNNYVTYAAGIHRSNGAAQIRCWGTTGCVSPADQTAFTPGEGSWYQVAVRFLGAKSMLYVDGVQQAAIGNAWTGGQLIGLTVNNANALFDDVTVRMAQDPEPPVRLRAAEHFCP